MLPSETNFTQLFDASEPIVKEVTAEFALSTKIVSVDPDLETVTTFVVLFLIIISFPALLVAAGSVNVPSAAPS